MSAKPFDVKAARELFGNWHDEPGWVTQGALEDACNEIDRLRARIGALVGDLTAADEQPTHFSSWFALLDVLGPGTAGEEKP